MTIAAANARAYDHVRCAICGTAWPEHASELCPHGRKPIEPESPAPPKPTRLTQLLTDITNVHAREAVENQVAILERRIGRWFHWTNYTLEDRATDEHRLLQLREWLEANR